MLSIVKTDLKAKAASILKNDRASLKSCQKCQNQPQNANKTYFDNVVSIIPYLKRNAGYGNDIA